MRDLASDVRYAVRTLREDPAFSLTVVGVLALGIGLNAAVFTMLKGIALTPLAGVAARPASRRLPARRAPDATSALSYPDFRYLRDHDRAFAGLFGSAWPPSTWDGPRRPPGLGRARHRQLLSGARRPRRSAAGRCSRPTRSRRAAIPSSCSAMRLWRRDFGADPAIVGTTVEINNYPSDASSASPTPTFHGTIVSSDIEVFIPVMMAPRAGFTFGSRSTTPSGILADPHRGGPLSAWVTCGRGTTLASVGRGGDALWATLARDRPADGRRAAAARRAVLAVSGRRQTYVLPTLSC